MRRCTACHYEHNHGNATRCQVCKAPLPPRTKR